VQAVSLEGSLFQSIGAATNPVHIFRNRQADDSDYLDSTNSWVGLSTVCQTIVNPFNRTIFFFFCVRSYTGYFNEIPVRLLGTRFEARNWISEPGPQEPYRDIFLSLSLLPWSSQTHQFCLQLRGPHKVTQFYPVWDILICSGIGRTTKPHIFWFWQSPIYLFSWLLTHRENK
jgi:hypothetical protein